MYKDVLRTMSGIELLPSISLILFFTFFVLLVIYLVKNGKEKWEDAANIPLETDDNNKI
ncbi:MAG: cbb3-type cytochrome c oxidase subunit 3 [Balneolaceae bacterium]